MIVQLRYIKQKTSRFENGLMIVPLIAVLVTSYFSSLNQASFLGISYQRHWFEASFQTFALLTLQLFHQLVLSIYSLMKLLP
ncbi:MAG: hypothetical protein NT153_10800 [Bacteroidetes bacterium]|nr:hypothetical protein [Bacteroidota bacterium]